MIFFPPFSFIRKYGLVGAKKNAPTGECGSLVSLSFWNGAIPNFNPKSIPSFTIVCFFLIQAPPGGALIVFFILLAKCRGRIEPLLNGSSKAEDGVDLTVR